MHQGAHGSLTQPAIIKKEPASRALTLRGALGLLSDTFRAWYDDNAMRLGAALAYYTVFSLAPFLVIVIAVAGFAFGTDAAQGRIVEQIRGLVGKEGAEAVSALLVEASRPRTGIPATILGFVMILLGATAVFGELQSGLNEIWKIPPPTASAFRRLARSRLRAFALVVSIGFLLLVSLVLSAVVAAVDEWLQAASPAFHYAIEIFQILVSFGLSTLLFALIFKVLPETYIAWSDVWFGAAVTALLFTIGQTALGLYLGNGSVGSVYGAAGSLVLILVWVYYSSQVLLFGAEFTYVYACRCGSRLCLEERTPAGPAPGVRRVTQDAPGQPRLSS